MYRLSSYYDFSKLDDKAYNKTMNIKVIKVGEVYLMKYLKEYLNEENLNTLGLFRSVLVDKEGVISYSPPKSLRITNDEIMSKFENSEVEEYVEGTMINVYWNKYLNDWDLCTRSNVGGRCRYNVLNKETFRYMFLDCMNNVNLSFEDLNKEYSYSFIMQHPNNRIVVPIKEHRLYLCNIYSFDNYDVNKVEIPEELSCFKIEKIKDETEITKYKLKLKNNLKYEDNDYRRVGIVFKNENGERCKLRNYSYEYVRRLKGNSPKLQYLYYNLRREKKVNEYLKYYPEHKVEFDEMLRDIISFTTTLYSMYIECYIRKEKPLKEFSKQYRTHMFKIHRIYLNELKENNKYVNRNEVIKYVNSLEPAHLMYSMNINYRKNSIEELKDTNVLKQVMHK